ncbi:MAG: hypothetical protein HY000_09515 [Planctomycetes bacterium]|nr:hypothetical protein [Planctomycetota bacterium]
MQDGLEAQVGEPTPESGPALLIAQPHIAGRIAAALLAAGAVGTFVAFVVRDPDHPVAWIALAASMILVLLAAALLVHRVTVYADCVEQRRLLGIRRLRFDEVTRVRLGAGRSAGSSAVGGAKLYGPGAKIGLGMVRDSADVYRVIASMVVPLLSEKLDREIDEAGAVRFGKVTAQADGLKTSKGLLPWHTIGSFASSPAGMRIMPTNRPELTVTIPNNTDNLPVLMWITESRKTKFRERLVQMAAERGLTEEQFLAALERLLPRGETFGFPEADEEFGQHLCTLPPGRFLGIGGRRGKFALYERGVVGKGRRIAIQDCASVAYQVVHSYHHGAYIGTTRSLTIRSRAGTKIRPSSMREEAETFCNAVLDRLLPQLVAEHLGRLAAGETIEYHKAQLTRDTLALRGKRIPLAQIRGVNEHQGSLYVWTNSNTKPVGSIDLATANALVLRNVLHEMGCGTL